MKLSWPYCSVLRNIVKEAKIKKAFYEACICEVKIKFEIKKENLNNFKGKGEKWGKW